MYAQIKYTQMEFIYNFAENLNLNKFLKIS